MSVLLSVLAIIVAILLIGIVLIQNPKGGGLNATGSATQLGGVKQTNDFLEKGTWTLAIALVVISIASASFIDKKAAAANNGEDSILEGVEVPVSTQEVAPEAVNTENAEETVVLEETAPVEEVIEEGELNLEEK